MSTADVFLLIAVASVAVTAGISIFLTLWFFIKVVTYPRDLLQGSELPRGKVILCLRGADPFLPECLNGISEQDYENFELAIVIDHPDDSSYPVVQKWLSKNPDAAEKVTVEFLDEKLPECSLKCSSIIQVVNKLEPEIDFIAIIDADVGAHPQWLRQLATGLFRKESIGAISGNRWFIPHETNVGSIVRATWIACSIVQMVCYRVAWGGSLAVKTATIRRADLASHWSKGFCEDTMLYSKLKPIGQSVEFQPHVLMVNRESSDLSGFSNWMSRQLLCLKLHHPAWQLVFGYGMLFPITLFCQLGWITFPNSTQSSWLIPTFIVSLTLLLINLPLIALSVRIAIGNRLPQIGLPEQLLRQFKLVFTLPTLGIVYFRGLFRTLFMRDVSWRGIDYSIEKSNVKLIEYEPYDDASHEYSSASIL